MKFIIPFLKNIKMELEENTTYREKGRLALSTVLKKNVHIIEKNIYKITKNDNDKKHQNYNKIIYQTIGDIINGINIKIILENIKKGKIGWKHKMFDEVLNRLTEHDDFIVCPFEVEEGVTECKKCGSKRVFTYSKQVRSQDEPMTTFAKCVKCKSNWTYSG